jgi:phage shock protein PspC (stress-responsive transcriptional regulator)
MFAAQKGRLWRQARKGFVMGVLGGICRSRHQKRHQILVLFGLSQFLSISQGID